MSLNLDEFFSQFSGSQRDQEKKIQSMKAHCAGKERMFAWARSFWINLIGCYL